MLGTASKEIILRLDASSAHMWVGDKWLRHPDEVKEIPISRYEGGLEKDKIYKVNATSGKAEGVVPFGSYVSTTSNIYEEDNVKYIDIRPSANTRMDHISGWIIIEKPISSYLTFRLGRV